MFGGISVRDNMSKILSRIFRVPVDGKPIRSTKAKTSPILFIDSYLSR